MTSILLGSDELTAPSAAAFARRPSGFTIRVDERAEQRIQRSRELMHELIATAQPMYGITTGFGDSCVRQISPDKVVALQRNLVQYHLNGFGPMAEREVVRATMLIRANCLARGYSGVRPDVVNLLVDCLTNDILPLIPERGSVGASGDLVPLCYLANALTGQGDVLFRGNTVPAAEAMLECGLEPVVLQAKEGLGLINGTSFMSAFALLALTDAAELAAVADVCTALAMEALLGNRGHFEAFIHEQKPHPGQLRSAATIHGMLDGSELAREYSQVLSANEKLGDNRFLELDHPIQNRYSLRCAPHVTGVLYDTVDWARRWVDVEINSTNDNPLFDVDAGTIRNGGNFYGGHIVQAMDSLKAAVGSVGDLLDRQLAHLVDDKFNIGLTPNLIPFINDEEQTGLHHGFKGTQLAASALVAEALKLGMPASAFSRSTEAHNQDKVSMGTIGARDARTVVELVQQVAAICLAATCQAIDLRGADKLGQGTRAAYELVRDRMAFLDHDRRLDHDLAGLVDLIKSGALGAVADKFGGDR
ncbi:histidine ammonia-lyase [Lentzea sp. NBRC 105346]|uniref:HAL/PAL/TAL family ammonia-lyase n=1 Tax=Lentzea sp. NBRC 105346 TaxID=3032205 RepID=UPI0024A42A1E|nr:aromatic amino acid ammonia-lyase [Lentzea sp. NBRC 105346]GLZ35694.1 histidine ammonia-lyase [Lentzea sp. NBRC 105346]